MRLLLAMLGLFIIAQVLGVYTGSVIIKDLTKNPYVSDLVVTTDAQDPANAIFFIAYILVGAAVMLLMIRYFSRLGLLLRLMELFLIASASSIVFYAFARLVFGYEISTVLGTVAGIIFSGSRLLVPGLKNAAAIMATAGVGVIFGISLGLIPLILFLVLLSIYDFLSVFKTKHMVEMAEFIVKEEMAFTVTATAPPPAPGKREQRVDLGTGDIIAPIMLEVSAMTFSPVAAAFVFVGAVVSLGVFLGAVWKKGMVLPALPPIVLGMITALGIGFLIGAY